MGADRELDEIETDSDPVVEPAADSGVELIAPAETDAMPEADSETTTATLDKQPKKKKSKTPFRGLILAALAVVAAVGVGYGMIKLTERGTVRSSAIGSGDSGQDAVRLSRDIADRGPILFQEPKLHFLQHLGEDARFGWYAFDPFWPGTECALKWNREARLFEPQNPEDAECAEAGADVVEATGEGQLQYWVMVDSEGVLVVDPSRNPQGEPIN